MAEKELRDVVYSPFNYNFSLLGARHFARTWVLGVWFGILTAWSIARLVSADIVVPFYVDWVFGTCTAGVALGLGVWELIAYYAYFDNSYGRIRRGGQSIGAPLFRRARAFETAHFNDIGFLVGALLVGSTHIAIAAYYYASSDFINTDIEFIGRPLEAATVAALLVHEAVNNTQLFAVISSLGMLIWFLGSTGSGSTDSIIENLIRGGGSEATVLASKMGKPVDAKVPLLNQQ